MAVFVSMLLVAIATLLWNLGRRNADEFITITTTTKPRPLANNNSNKEKPALGLLQWRLLIKPKLIISNYASGRQIPLA